MAKKMIQIGAGNIGRACIGRLFHQANYEIYFSDINAELISMIHERKEYNVRMVGKDFDETIKIDNVDKVSEDRDEFVRLSNEIEIITTAVGVNILPKIASFIVDIINIRHKYQNNNPLNIMACENTTGASSKLKESVYNLLDLNIREWIEKEKNIAFPNVAIDCIVPNIENENPLTVTCENFADLIIDRNVFIGNLPNVEGLSLKENLNAYIERKLFTLNTGHAITAYLGAQKNKETIYEAINDSEIKNIVLCAMRESGEVLIKRHGFKSEEHETYIQKILNRFFNPYLKDSVFRVGREPMRKLSYNDRLIKPILGTLEYNLRHDNLLKGVISAFKFYSPDDKESVELKRMLKNEKLEKVILKITELDINKEKEKELYNEIYNELKPKKILNKNKKIQNKENNKMKVIIAKDSNKVGMKVAAEIINLLKVKKDAVLGLATGGTAEAVYPHLIKSYNKKEIDFKKVKTINLDEYKGLDGKNEQSYRYFMDKNLFEHVNIEKKNTFVPKGIGYKEKNLKEFNDKINKNPRDLQLLGVGANGHIAFNEPNDFLHSDALCVRLDKKTIKANSRYFKSEKQVPKEAFSMGMGGILKAKKIIIAAIGKNKASAIKELLSHDKITTKCPVTFLKLHNDVTVIIDEEIAKAIGYKSSKK
nr:mannitol-1-phosphate 5-dehydrogenase [uncultured Brachyspira sp.]